MHKTREKKLVFIVGCPRSGTTWLQIMLSQHPKVLTCPETHLFSNYIRALRHQWDSEGSRDKDLRGVGLRENLDAQAFFESIGAFTEKVFDKIAQSDPDCDVILEKTPQHVFDLDLIRSVYPDALFIHVVRDPRAVCASLQSASKTWGRHWAPGNTVDGARLWNASVTAAQSFKQKDNKTYEVRYEDLKSSCEALLLEMFEWIGCRADSETTKQICKECNIENMRAPNSALAVPWKLEDEPTEFYRRGDVDSWREELSSRKIKIIEFINHDLMEEYKYIPKKQHIENKPLEIYFDNFLSIIFVYLLKFIKFSLKKLTILKKVSDKIREN